MKLTPPPQIAATPQLPVFATRLIEQIPGIERLIAAMRRKPDDKALCAELIAVMQQMDAQAGLGQAELVGRTTRALTRVLERLTAGELKFDALLAELCLLTSDRLELAAEALLDGRPLSVLRFEQLIAGLEQLAHLPASQVQPAIIALIEVITGYQPVLAGLDEHPVTSVIARSSEQVAADLLFFRALSKQLEDRSALFKGRRQRLLQLAFDTNDQVGRPIDPVQLEAAVYMHDVGMMFLPEALWLKVGRITEDERFQMQVHPSLAAGLLERMPGWQAAAQMVAQHHEMPDGAGYPRGLKARAICPGAKVLAIIDAFEAVMLKHSDRGHNRSALRAIAEVNACEGQFAAEWIAPFNAVVRRMLGQ